MVKRMNYTLFMGPGFIVISSTGPNCYYYTYALGILSYPM